MLRLVARVVLQPSKLVLAWVVVGPAVHHRLVVHGLLAGSRVGADRHASTGDGDFGVTQHNVRCGEVDGGRVARGQAVAGGGRLLLLLLVPPVAMPVVVVVMVFPPLPPLLMPRTRVGNVINLKSHHITQSGNFLLKSTLF